MSDVHRTESDRRALFGALLFTSAVFALAAANSSFAQAYYAFWHGTFYLPGALPLTAKAVVDQGLMTFFFLNVGLELKRELIQGSLRHPRAMALPFFAALGGMVVPAVSYALLNGHGPAASGWGIPMSTDVAFAAGTLVLLGHRVPRGLLAFLLALAIVDDVGAILVIAFYYTKHVSVGALLWAAGIMAALIVLNRRHGKHSWPYLVFAILLWGALSRAGVDAPLAGVLVAAALPLTTPQGSHVSLVSLGHRTESRLAPYVAFVIMPMFALANAGLALNARDLSLRSPVFLGIFLGLFLGKFCGVGAASWLVLRLRWARLPNGVGFRHVLGAAWLSGIGFTMALFINTLAFDAGPYRAEGKAAILFASFFAAVIGMAWLWRASALTNPGGARGRA